MMERKEGMLYPQDRLLFSQRSAMEGGGLWRLGRVGRGSGDAEEGSFGNSESAPLCYFFQENLVLQNTDQQGHAADPWPAL